MAETTAVAKPEPVTLARPDFLTKDDRRGTEHITKDDIKMPRLALSQNMSYQVQRTHEKFIKDLRTGELFNDLTGEILGEGPVDFMIIRADKPRWIEFHPRESGGGIKDMNVPHNDPRTKFGPNGEKPAATQFYDYVIYLLGRPADSGILALSLKSSGLKTARHLNSLIKLRGATLWAGRYTLKVASEKNQKGEFFVYSIKNSATVDEFTAKNTDGSAVPGWVNQELMILGDELFNSYKDRELKIERDDHDDTGGVAEGGATPVNESDVPF